MRKLVSRIAASVVLVACNTGNGDDPAGGGTDTGNPNDDRGLTGNDEIGQLCDQTERELGLDESTSIGVSAGQLFSWVGGEHREALLWLDDNANFGPEHDRSEITIDVQPLGARFIDRRPAERRSNGEARTLLETDIGSLGDPCADSIALGVRLHVSTAGGALAETLETTLEANAGDFVSGRVSLPTDRLTGSFEASVELPLGFVARGAPQLILELGLSKYGSRGQLGLSSEFVSSDGQAVGQGGLGILARFPADDFCETGGISVAADQSVRGVSVAEVLERLNAASPARLDGSTATLELTFQSSAQRLCVALDAAESGTTTLEFPGRVTLRSSDQGIAGTIDVTLSGEASAGVLERSAAAASAFLLDSARAAAAVSRYAIQQPLDFSSYDGGAFEFSASVSDAEAVGALRAYGLDQADCVTNPPPPDPDAQGSPGCRGTDRIELWRASWAKP